MGLFIADGIGNSPAITIFASAGTSGSLLLDTVTDAAAVVDDSGLAMQGDDSSIAIILSNNETSSTNLTIASISLYASAPDTGLFTVSANVCYVGIDNLPYEPIPNTQTIACTVIIVASDQPFVLDYAVQSAQWPDILPGQEIAIVFTITYASNPDVPLTILYRAPDDNSTVLIPLDIVDHT